MKGRLELKLVTLGVSITAAIIYAVCVLAYLALPKSIFDALWKPMFHWLYGATPTTLVLGLLETVIYSAVAAAIFVLIYNYLQKER